MTGYPEDHADEQMAEAVYDAMNPIREWFKGNSSYNQPTTADGFERAHEDCEILLMKLLDKYYGNGFKDGAADERYVNEMAELERHSHEI